MATTGTSKAENLILASERVLTNVHRYGVFGNRTPKVRQPPNRTSWAGVRVIEGYNNGILSRFTVRHILECLHDR